MAEDPQDQAGDRDQGQEDEVGGAAGALLAERRGANFRDGVLAVLRRAALAELAIARGRGGVGGAGGACLIKKLLSPP